MPFYCKYFLTHVTHMRNVRNERYGHVDDCTIFTFI